ncbi:MAG: hypothetical protein WC061_09115, partial [Melioribacteraceae bacterium]
IILSNPVYGTLYEFDISSGLPDAEIKLDAAGLRLDPFRRYYWRVYAFTASGTEPNSYSADFTFTYSPTN